MSVNSTNRAKTVTKADSHTLAYVISLTNAVFGSGYNAPVLVYESHFDPDEYLASLIASPTDPACSQSQYVDLGLHSGTTREEALLGLLHSLEKKAAEKSEKDTIMFWAECYKMRRKREEEEAQAKKQTVDKEDSEGA